MGALKARGEKVRRNHIAQPKHCTSLALNLQIAQRVVAERFRQAAECKRFEQQFLECLIRPFGVLHEIISHRPGQGMQCAHQFGGQRF